MWGSDPPDGARDVERAALFRVFFDRPVLPADVHRGRVALSSGARNAFLGLVFDPVERALIASNQGAPLDPEVVWRLSVRDVRDLDGRPMAPWTIAVRTGGAIGGGALPSATFAEVEPIFTARCATEGCHAGAAPVLGLDLSSAAGIARTLVGAPAAQTRVGAQEAEAWPGALGLAGLPRVDVAGGRGDPARSYVLYKVIGDPHALGQRMPPPPAEPLTEGERALLSAWILAGAATD